MADVAMRRPKRRVALKHRIVLNVPIDLAQRLLKLAERERRPLSTQIQILIERALEDEPKEVGVAA